MTREQAFQSIKNYLQENEDDFIQLVEDRMSYDGWHADDEIFSMYDLYEFNQINNSDDFDNLMNRIYFGHDENNGPKSSFNPNREYFYYNGYANLVSTDYKDYSAFMDELIDCILNGELDCNYFTMPEEINRILDEIRFTSEGE